MLGPWKPEVMKESCRYLPPNKGDILSMDSFQGNISFSRKKLPEQRAHLDKSLAEDSLPLALLLGDSTYKMTNIL